MAYAVLSSLAQTILQILNHDQYLISDNDEQQLKSLRKQVILLQEYLDNIPKEAISLEIRIRDAASQVEDLLEHFMYDQLLVDCKSTANNPPRFLILKGAMEEINSISQEAADFKTEDAPLSDKATVPTSLSTPAPAAGSDAIGLDDDFLKIAELLRGESSKRQIIPIVGMGGIGKTTLARKAYYDPLITESFPFRAWVTVSQDYKAQNIFLDLLHSLKGVSDERSGHSNDCTQVEVYKFLKGWKYLIVLDDMWSHQAWDDVRNFFPDDNNGSGIVITTRLEDVASYADSSSSLHKMSFMDSGQSWNLLKKKVFPIKDCPSGLEEIGREIARQCGGLPLAVVLVAGILSTVSETRHSWIKVAEKVDLAGELEKIISLSYTNLPHHLRACFLYMGAFPEDYEIRVSKLIKLWMAEGFIKPREGKSIEEGAIEYLEDLVKRSLALVTRRKSNGGIKSCNVHDLVREVCKRRAEEENFQRRVSIGHPDLTLLARTYGSNLRSVICFYPSKTSLGALHVLRLLRVLDVVGVNVSSFAAQVFELFHLRYLAFDCGHDMEIPTAISRLRNLRTLIIWSSKTSYLYSTGVLYLPLEIWTMPLLTHLASFFSPLPDPDIVASPLEKLLSLSTGRRFICTKKMTEMIPNIKKLGITYFGEENEEQDYQLHNLVLLHQLEKLKLVLKADSIVRLKFNPIFPGTLIKLTLSGWRLPWKYMEVVGSLPNLQVLKLRNNTCAGDTWETNEEQFPNLEFLHIQGFNFKKWITEASHFPRLKRLVLYHCYGLDEIPDDIGEIPTLELIEVDYGNEFLVKCVKRIQEEQHDNGNYDLQVRCVNVLQKIVIQVPLTSDNDKSKAMRIAVSVSGVTSVSLSFEENKNSLLVITGDSVDAVQIIKLLRKKFGHASLVFVGGGH